MTGSRAWDELFSVCSRKKKVKIKNLWQINLEKKLGENKQEAPEVTPDPTGSEGSECHSCLSKLLLIPESILLGNRRKKSGHLDVKPHKFYLCGIPAILQVWRWPGKISGLGDYFLFYFFSLSPKRREGDV